MSYFEIRPTGSGILIYTSGYNEAFVEELKSTIPPEKRSWTGEAWWVHEEWADEAGEIASRHYDDEA